MPVAAVAARKSLRETGLLMVLPLCANDGAGRALSGPALKCRY
jgi:hypothetical protein